MKYLSNYVEAAQTALFDKTGTFFAFNLSQFEAGIKEGIEYTSLGAGIICPTENIAALNTGLSNINAAGIAQDIADNGKEAIITRELHNYEAFYLHSLTDTVNALEDYGYTREDIRAVYNRVAPTVDLI